MLQQKKVSIDSVRAPEAHPLAPEPPVPSRTSPTLSPDHADAWSYVRSRCGAMTAVERRALLVAPSDETVLILGETGVGKDVMARLVHQHSSRKERVFVHLNCAALPENLLEPELFGHMRGSYTGATDSRPGQFEVASGGTLFLDEIGELPLRLQAKLLHVLQERKIYRVGGRQPLNVDVRVIAATNRDLGHAIRTGGFRRDLFYRLSVVSLRIPPLRERHEDLEDLALHFFRRYSSLYNRPDLAAPDDRLLHWLKSLAWEGNIRELENVVKRVILLGGTGHMEDEMLAPHGNDPALENDPAPTAASAPVCRPLKETARQAAEQAERQSILSTLQRTAWNRKRAARELHVSYRALLYKIKDYTLHPGAVPMDDGQGSSSH